MPRRALVRSMKSNRSSTSGGRGSARPRAAVLRKAASTHPPVSSAVVDAVLLALRVDRHDPAGHFVADEVDRPGSSILATPWYESTFPKNTASVPGGSWRSRHPWLKNVTLR